MTVHDGKRQFESQVFPTELEEIRRRRRNAGDNRPLWDEARPTTKHNLIGLAFSGGGIRSASFSMGVAQHLISKGLFGKVDLLSTVSGGGFTGGCLSALMHGAAHGERLLVDRPDGREPPALNHVRNCSNYLMPQGLLNQLRLPALLMAGVFHTVVMLLPLVVLAVFLTELFFEVTGYVLIDTRHWVPLLGVIPLVLALIRRPLRAGRGAWSDRDGADERLGRWLLLAVLSILAVPSMKWLSDIVNYDAAWVLDNVQGFLRAQEALGLRSWLLWTGIIGSLALVFGAIWLRMRLVLALVGTLAPLFMFSLYVFLCIFAINSPIAEDRDGRLRDAMSRAYEARRALPPNVEPSRSPGSPEAEVETLVRALLRTKQIDLDRYRIEWSRSNADELLLDRQEDVPTILTWLTSQRSPLLHIHFAAGPLTFGDHSNIVIDELSLLRGYAEWWLYLSGLLLWAYAYFFMDVNRVSIHPFYRDRLSRTFLIKPTGDPKAPVMAADELRLSELGGADGAAPYHLINTALNLQGSDDPQLRERKTVPFVLAQRFCGCDDTGYLPTGRVEAMDPCFNLGSAIAISAAAASPNMGAITVRPLTFLLTFLNIRLNYWLPNPAWDRQPSWYNRLRHSKPGLTHLLHEALGNVDRRRAFINCSDGGHIENLAVYELLRRRCRTIVCVDGESDPHFTFFGFTTLQRYAEIDFGARIDINLDPIRPDVSGMSKQHHAVGTITYLDGEQGTFTYFKLSLTGDEPEYLRYYKREAPDFPHESTADQFFGETQFEIYRALGSHVAAAAVEGEHGLRATLLGVGDVAATA